MTAPLLLLPLLAAGLAAFSSAQPPEADVSCLESRIKTMEQRLAQIQPSALADLDRRLAAIEGKLAEANAELGNLDDADLQAEVNPEISGEAETEPELAGEPSEELEQGIEDVEDRITEIDLGALGEVERRVQQIEHALAAFR